MITDDSATQISCPALSVMPGKVGIVGFLTVDLTLPHGIALEMWLCMKNAYCLYKTYTL